MKRFLILLMVIFLVGCKKSEQEVTVNKKTLLENTINKIDVYHFITHKKGSKVVIIGGIHGDEEAGYLAAERLLEDNPFTGEVLLIPRANYLATQLKERYPGVRNSPKGLYDGVIYSDLNRCLPGDENGSITEKIAFEIIKVIKEFEPEYIIDLHESLRSYSDSQPRLGDSLIYSNQKSAWIAMQVLEYFNETYLEEGDVVFRLDSSAPDGSFNNYLGSLGYITLTIETNRKLNLEKRITQQLNLVKSFFHIIDS